MRKIHTISCRLLNHKEKPSGLRGLAQKLSIVSAERLALGNYRNVERLMGKTVDEMSENELIAEIQRLQAVRVPSTKPKAPKRMDDAKRKKDPAKRSWRDELFGE